MGGIGVIYVLNGRKNYMKAWQGKSKMTLTTLILTPLIRVCHAAVSNAGGALEYVPESLRTEALMGVLK
jgi:hypothetical protein